MYSGLLFLITSAIMGSKMKKVQKVSVLVPIYNVEKYLRQCLESLVNQTLQEIEIICLNDGSTDGSLAIIKEFAERDDRIVIVDKENSGYGDSMNQGLEKARGEYVAIVESDDFIDLDALEKLYMLATTYDVEVVRANYYFNKGGKDKKNYYINPVDTGRVVDPARHTWIFYQSPAIWSAIYRREFLQENEIKFLPTPGASYQDTGFNFKVWALAHRAYFTTEAFLHYRIDNESSSINSAGKVMNVVYEYGEIEKFLKEHNLYEDLAPMMQAAKFGAYYWNMDRLKRKLLPDFLKAVKTEYQEAAKEGLLHKEYFVNKGQWELLQYILKHAIWRSVWHIEFSKIGHKIREICKTVWIKSHPTYRKQKKIAETIAELNAECDLIATKLNNLENSCRENPCH